ncbi:MAG: archease [candidate division WOR-3 bacterium]|nr:archease [candidate division WOR-3 bacterium]MCX7756975.1 archease [candidate division WOR-3 bacterium]MDW7987940.1 archease [candidate division WOR-3 bacterium]
MRYRYIDHTSDLGVEIYGKNLQDLFKNAQYALFDNILDLSTVEVKSKKTITISSETLEELFMDWLRELLFRFATEYFITKEVNSLVVNQTKLSAEVAGEYFDPARHQIKIEIKTPTYHNYKITATPDGYKATVIFDV